MLSNIAEYFQLPLSNPVLIFTVILFIILISPILFGKIRIPHLIGLILAGAIIGPHGINLMLRDSSIVLFGTVGLLYLMFLAGIEIDLADFQRNRFKSIVFGLYTFIIPMTIGTIVGLYVLNYSLPTSILLASMFASHTLITYPIVSKMGISRNVAVGVAVGGTIITDTLALLVLAVIAAMVKGELNSAFMVQLSISFLIFVAGIMVLFPMLTRWFFKKNEDGISQFIFVLALLFLAGFLSQLAGVEPIIGAFLAGITLNRFIPFNSPLMNRIHFVGNALFIPFFLIGVGMLINFNTFFGNIQTIRVGLVMTVVATFGKYAAAWLTQKTFGMSNDQRNIIFGLSNSQAAATLAAIIVGYNIILSYDPAGNPIRLLDENILNGTVLMIMVTCIISSFATQRSASNLALAQSNESSGDKEPNEKILIPINNLDNVDMLINLSLSIKSKHNSSPINVLNVVGNNDSEQMGKRIVDKATEIATATDNTVNCLIRHNSNTLNGIVNVVKELKITDIVLGLHKSTDISDNFLGNLTDNLLLRCPTNTLIIRFNQPLATIKRTLVLIPERAEKEIGFAFWVIKLWNFARYSNSPLHFYGNENTFRFLRQIQQKHPIEASFEPLNVWQSIDSVATKPDDMVVFIMSRRKRTSFHPQMNRIANHIEKHFTNKPFILLYPLQASVQIDHETDLSSLLDLETLKKNIEQLDEVGKEIVKLFWKK